MSMPPSSGKRCTTWRKSWIMYDKNATEMNSQNATKLPSVDSYKITCSLCGALYRAQIIFTPPQVRKVECTVLTQYEGAVLLNIFSFSEFSGSTFKKNLERTNCVSQKITPAASLMISTMNGCEKKELEEISFTSVAIDSIKTLLFLSSARWCVRAFVATSGVTRRQHSRERERENSKEERARRVRVCAREPIRSVFFSGLSLFLRPHTKDASMIKRQRTGPFLLFSRSQKKTPTRLEKSRFFVSPHIFENFFHGRSVALARFA